MQPLRSPSLDRRPGRWLAALLVLALLYVQALGQAHRVAHPHVLAQDAGHAHAQHPATPSAGPAWLHDSTAEAEGTWFGHAQDAEECRLFDQLSLGDLTPALFLLGSAPPVAARVKAAPPGAPRSPPCLPYRARGPPPAAIA